VTLTAPLRLLVLFALLLGGCEGSYVATVGHDLSDTFPERGDWFWRYNNDDFVEEVYWWGLGETSPQDESWITFRWWVNEAQVIIEDFDGDEGLWDVETYWKSRADGFYFMGWSANDSGPSADLATEFMPGDGVPFAMSNILTGQEWTAEVGDRTWTMTATEELEPLSFNGNLHEGVWRIDMQTEAQDVPFEGSFWMSQGAGFVQWDVPRWRGEGGLPWQHIHNDTWTNRFGVSNP